jgi:hypothetical protein
VASGQGHGDRVPGYGAAGAAFPNFGGPVPGEQQDVREDNAGGESGSHVQAPQPGK